MQRPSTFLLFTAILLSLLASPVDSVVAASPLGDWKFRYMKVRGKKIKVIRSSRITLTLEPGDRCSGNGGINQFFGACEITKRRRSILFPDDFGRTKIAGPLNLLRQESRFLRRLEQSRRYQLRGDRMILGSGNRRVKLFFRRT